MFEKIKQHLINMGNYPTYSSYVYDEYKSAMDLVKEIEKAHKKETKDKNDLIAYLKREIAFLSNPTVQ